MHILDDTLAHAPHRALLTYSTENVCIGVVFVLVGVLCAVTVCLRPTRLTQYEYDSVLV